MDFHFFTHKLIQLADKGKMHTVKPQGDGKDIVKVKHNPLMKAPMGPAAYLATVNQAVGPQKNKQKDVKRQDIKQKLRREVQDHD